MKKNFLLISALFLSTSVLKAEEQKQSSQTEPKVNIGLKAGFNSSMYFTSRLQLDGQRFEDIQNNYKVGYFVALFFRFNMKRHFIQPEFTYNVNKGDITFDKNQNNETLPPDFATIRSTIHSLEIPLLYGYSFVKSAKSHPYGMAFFIGPKLEYIWKRKTKEEFSNFGHDNIQEELHPINVSSVIGLGVNISNIFFDFRYEIGLTNISKEIIYEKNTNGEISHEKGIVINRHKNVLSFSLGVIF